MSCGLTLASTINVRFRNDQHDRVAGGDHAADCVHLRFQHDAVLRRADVDALELIFRRDLALDEFTELGVDLAHVLGDLAAQVLIDLDDLEFGLRYLALGLRNGRYQLPAFALEPRAVALQRGETGDLHQVVFLKLAHAFELLPDQRISRALASCWAVRPRFRPAAARCAV